MKKLPLFLLNVLLPVYLLSQQAWMNNLPQEKLQNGELTFYEIQKAFNDYWEPFNVKNGFYKLGDEKVKAPYWKQFRRWEWYWESRINPKNGEFPKTTAWEELQKSLKENPEIKSPSGNWTSMGPSSTTGGYAGLGRLNCVAFSPDDNNIIYVGAASGGLWKTINGGSSWTPLGDNNQVLGVSDIIVIDGLSNPDTLYIATGDRDGGSMWSLGGGQYNDNNSVGVLKSTDGGSTWNTTGLTFTTSQQRTINRMLLDPNDHNTIYSATSAGLYKTTDAGTNWTLLTSTHFIDIKFKPGTPSTIYASNWTGDIYRSLNSGVSFTSVFTTSNERVELAVSDNNSNIVYALMENGGGLGGIYKSTDGASSFSQVYSGSLNFMGWNCNGGDSGGQGSYDLCIAADPTNANNVFIGGVNTWRSTDGGVNWSITNHWSGCSGISTVHADKHYLAYQNGTSTLFECNDGGLYKTSDNGVSWSHIGSGLITSQIYRLGVAQTSSSDVIVGLQDNGTKALLTGTWSDEFGGDGFECAYDYTDHNTIYGELYYGDIRRTINHGSSWSSISSGLSGSAHWCAPFLIDPNVNTTIYMGYQDIFKSTNKGSSWTKISSWGGSTLRSLAVAPSNSNYIYVATTSSLYKTSDGGANWSSDLAGALPTGSGSITYTWVKDDDPNTVWVSMGGYNSYGVYQSTDGGTNWTNISSGLPSIPVMCVIQNKQNTSQVELYAATDVGVYVKVEPDNWTSFNSSLPNVVVTELDIYYDNTTPANSRIRAATYGRGLWESELYSNPVPNTWTGASSTSWNVSSNWSSNSVPTQTDEVIIPDDPDNWPTKTGSLTVGTDCKSLSMVGASQLTITGDMTIPPGNTITISNEGKLTVGGNWLNTGSFSPGTGTVIFNGGSNSSIDNSEVSSDNLQTTFADNNGASGNMFKITALNDVTILNFDGNLQSGTGTVYIYYKSGTYVGYETNSSAWTFAGSASVTSTGSGSPTPIPIPVDIEIPGGQTYSFYIHANGGNRYTNGSSEGTIFVSDANIQFFEGCGKGSPLFTGSTYKPRVFNGIIYYTHLNMSGSNSYHNLVIDKSNAEVQNNANMSVLGDLTVNPGAWFTNSSSGSINVSGQLNIEASDSDKASFIDNGTLNVAGITKVENNYSNNRWHFVSSPLSSALSAIFTGIYLKEHDESTNTYSSTISILDHPLTPGKGFEIWSSSDNFNASYTGGMLNQGDFSVIVSAFDANSSLDIGEGEGWNFIGNPFASAITLGSVNNDPGYTWINLDNTVYIWSDTYNTGNPVWATYNRSGDGIGQNGGTEFLPSMQGFFVKANDFNPALTIPNNARLHSSHANYKNSLSTNDLIRLEVAGNNFTDELVLRTLENATLSFDTEYDGYKLYGSEDAAYIYSLAGEISVCISTIPEIYESLIIPVHVKIGTPGIYTLWNKEFELENELPVYLEDLQSGSFELFEENSEYVFTVSEPDIFYFNLHFKNVIGLPEYDFSKINIYSFEQTIYIKSTENITADIYIYDGIGREIYSAFDNYGTNIQIPLTVQKGFYIVKIVTAGYLRTEKVLIK